MDDDLNKIMQTQGTEELEILAKCMMFIEELKKITFLYQL